MPRVERTGKRKTREQLAKRRVPELGYYYIVTDTKETERNYMLGLRDSIPKEYQGKLVVKVIKIDTKNLVEEALRLASLNPQYGEIWIVFDRDQFKDFDKIICQAKAKGVNVGWAKPCIEAWFSSYFGSMPTYHDSVSCCSGFVRTYEQATGQKYEKADLDIYDKLNCFGNEQKAIELAEQKYKQRCPDQDGIQSKMCPCTTVHALVKEIKTKVKTKEN